jgi:hypothetical protein
MTMAFAHVGIEHASTPFTDPCAGPRHPSFLTSLAWTPHLGITTHSFLYVCNHPHPSRRSAHQFVRLLYVKGCSDDLAL